MVSFGLWVVWSGMTLLLIINGEVGKSLCWWWWCQQVEERCRWALCIGGSNLKFSSTANWLCIAPSPSAPASTLQLLAGLGGGGYLLLLLTDFILILKLAQVTVNPLYIYNFETGGFVYFVNPMVLVGLASRSGEGRRRTNPTENKTKTLILLQRFNGVTKKTTTEK